MLPFTYSSSRVRVETLYPTVRMLADSTGRRLIRPSLSRAGRNPGEDAGEVADGGVELAEDRVVEGWRGLLGA
ncbi:hypothetical protein GCM10009744_04090 [Kribbella alba]|uniref:Uncharacterized protein n=1 Tax=Kribbella alba TaxID=190197 RepID=A0ABN2EZV1_9ACTN